jgi:hypothetical protein
MRGEKETEPLCNLVADTAEYAKLLGVFRLGRVVEPPMNGR